MRAAWRSALKFGEGELSGGGAAIAAAVAAVVDSIGGAQWRRAWQHVGNALLARRRQIPT